MIKKCIFIIVLALISTFISCKVKEPQLKKSPETVGKLIINDLLSRPEFMIYETPGVYAVHYAEACAGYGSLKLAGLLNDKSLIANLENRYKKVEKENIPNTENHVDTNVYGILPLEFYIQTNNKNYLKHGIKLANGQWKDSLPNGLSSQARFWIDDIYMISALQIQAYRVTGNMIYLERAALTVKTYIKELQQPNGLFFHGPEAPFFWGRGNGWVAAGFAELLSVLPKNNPYYNSILNGYKKMMKTLIEYQNKDGMWHQLINHKESFKESSSTAMFGFAMALGVKKKLLPKTPYEETYVKAWNALTEYLNDDGKIREICVGTGQSLDINYYLNRPRITGDLHGQAPMLWFTYSLITD